MFHPPMLGRRAAGVTFLGLLAGCANMPPVPTATLPDTVGLVTLEPGRQAILHTSSVFATASRLAGHPADAALAISETEFLAVELRHNQRWQEFSPLVQLAFEQARPEWRGVLGIAQDAQPQAVIDAMTRVRFAVGAQDMGAAAAAMAPPLFNPGGQAALSRLSALPYLPRTAAAARAAEQELWRMQLNRGGDSWR